MKEKIRHFFNYQNYDYKFTLRRFIDRCRRCVSLLFKQTGTIRRIGLIIMSLLVVQGILHFLDIASLSTNVLANIFISAGAMTGGIIAIVFTLSIFAQQNAANLYSSQYFEVYTHDWKEKSTYFVIVIIILLFFGAGIFFNSSSQILTETIKISGIYFSLFSIGLIFALIDWQYEHVRIKINPLNALKFLEKQAIKSLNDIHKNAERIAKIIKAKNTDVTKELALASAYNYLSPYIANIDKQLENLFEISMKLSDRQEVNATNRGLAAVHNILSKYFELRKDSSLALTSHLYILAVESDSQGFLTKSLERLNSAGEKFIRTKKTENAIYIIDIYKSLARHVKEIKFLGQSNENPIFEQIKGYFIYYIDFAVREKDQEIVFQGVQALKNFALIAIEKKLLPALLGIQKDFMKLATFGITEKKTFIIDVCVDGWLTIIKNVFFYKFFVTRYAISEALDNIGKTTVYMYMATKTGYLSNDFISSMSLSKPYNEMSETISLILSNYFEIKKEREKSSYKSDVVVLFKELYSSLRNLSEEIKECSSVLIDSIGRLIFYIDSSLIKLVKEDDFNDIRDSLLKCLGWYIHLPSLFVYHTEIFKSSNAFNTLIDSIAKTGIMLFKIKDSDKLIMDCVSALNSTVKQSLKKIERGHGYDEPRIMQKLVYLGVLALKHNKESILTEVGIRIYEFEELYKKKYLSDLRLPKGIDPDKVIGLPKEDQLYLDIFEWRNDFVQHKYNRHRLMDDSKDRMFGLIDELDIDRFMFEIWGSFPDGSSIEQEIEEKFKKERKTVKIKELIIILQNIFNNKSK